MIAEQGARRKLIDQLKEGYTATTFVEDLIGHKSTDRICQTIGGGVAMTSAVLAAYQMKCNRRALGKIGMALFGLATAAAPSVNNLSERISLTTEGDYSGPFWPFVMSLGEQDPTQAQIIELTEQLLKR